MQWKEEWEKEDRVAGEKLDKRTMREIRKMSDSILPYIKFKEDVASDREEGKLPMLDFTVWKMEEKDSSRKVGKKTEIYYEFYEKPMANELVIMESTGSRLLLYPRK